MSLQRYSEERRTRALEQYKDFFEASTDGMVVLDGEARDPLRQPRRRADDRLRARRPPGRDFTELVAPGAARRACRTSSSRWSAAPTSRSFDLALSTTSGETLTVSVSTSSVLAEHGGAVLAFRDVTEARALEGELRKTKDFLERLIDSTVDGIIGADMRGNIILFNQGAARLFGYSPDEVIGKLPVWKLYPDGVARADHGRAALDRSRRRRAPRADAARDRHQGRRAGAGVADRVDRLRGRARGRHRRHHQRPARAPARSSSGWRRRRRSWSSPRSRRSSPSWPAPPRTSSTSR